MTVQGADDPGWDIRASHRDREAVVAVLRDAFIAGRLALDEFDERTSAAYAGKTWGELPGELRTKIVQDMRVKYGEDYARMIKLYFEQLADTKREGK